MSTFDERETAFELKFKHDEELKFRILARRNKLIGLWAAEEMGLEDAKAYAGEVIESDFEEPGSDDVVRKLLNDFQQHKIEFSRHRIEKKMEEFLAIAADQIKNEIPDAD